LTVYIHGIDFNNIHIFEHFWGLHIVAPVRHFLPLVSCSVLLSSNASFCVVTFDFQDLMLYRKIQAVQYLLVDVFTASGLLGCSILYDGHVVWQGGLTKAELNLIYRFLQVGQLSVP